MSENRTPTQVEAGSGRDSNPMMSRDSAMRMDPNDHRWRSPNDGFSCNDPNDPRNWDYSHKSLTYGTICLFSFMANVNASAFTVATQPLAMYFHVDLTKATMLTALNVLMFGLGNIFWVPLMRIIGKRPVYLLAIMVLIGSNAWSANATSWGSLLASRMVSGFGASAADATVPDAVKDLYYGKERAHHMMFFHFALASGIFIGPFLNGYAIQNHGWWWSPGWMAIVFGILLFLAFFFIHETEYQKEHRHYFLPELPEKRPFWSYLSLTLALNRENPKERVFQTLKDIVVLTAYPQILWAACLVGLFVGWTIIIQITAASTFLNPKGLYRWTISRAGLFHLSGWIGICVAFYLGGMLIDRIAHRAVQRSEDKILRPRMRLLGLPGPAVIAPLGLIVYGVCMAHATIWVGPAFGYAMHSFGFAAASNIAVTYAVDSYGDFGGEALVSLFIIRNIIGVVCSFYCNKWVAADGFQEVFGIMAGLEWVFLLLTIPMYFFTDHLIGLMGKFGPQKRLMDERAAKERREAEGSQEHETRESRYGHSYGRDHS